MFLYNNIRPAVKSALCGFMLGEGLEMRDYGLEMQD